MRAGTWLGWDWGWIRLERPYESQHESRVSMYVGGHT